MDDILKRKHALETKIAELEDALEQVKLQLHDEIEKDQHKEIDRLDEYLGLMDSKYINLKDYWTIVRKEINELFSSTDDKN